MLCPGVYSRDLPADNHRTAVAEQTLIGGYAHLCTLNLAVSRLAAQLPGQFADLGQSLSRYRLAKAGQSAGDIDRNLAAQCGIAVAQQSGRLTAWGQAQIFDPVQFQRGG